MTIRWYRNIKFRIAFSFSVVFACFVSAGNFYLYQRVSRSLTSADNAYLLSRANTLLEKADAYPAVIPLPGQHEHIALSVQNGRQHALLFRSPDIGHIPAPKNDGITETAKYRLATVSRYVDNSQTRLRLSLVKSIHPLLAEKRALFLELAGVSLAAILLAAITAYYIAELLLKPIRNIVQSARKISHEKALEAIPVPQTGDEVNELALTLNNMLGRIRESTDQQNAFFTSASHELKTPLAIMKTELELARSQFSEPESARLIASQLDEVNFLQRIVEQFLVVGQLRAQRLVLHKTPCIPHDVLLQVLQKMQPRCAAENLEVHLELSQQIRMDAFPADEDKLAMVFGNLLENAIRYAAAPKVLNISIDSEHGYQLRFENAIPDEGSALIDYKGAFIGQHTGLGLWLSAQIIELHGGHLSVRAENHLFSVTLFLPV